MNKLNKRELDRQIKLIDFLLAQNLSMCIYINALNESKIIKLDKKNNKILRDNEKQLIKYFKKGR